MSLSSLKLSLILIPLAIGASYLHAQTTPPPGDNLAPPVHTLSGSQIKTSGLSLNGFVAQQRATFKQDTFISGVIKGALPGAASSTVSFGRTTDPVFAQVTGVVENTLTLGSDKLKNTASRTVCGTTGGEVVLCDQSPICSNSVMESPEQCDDGNIINGDGCSSSCTIEPAPVDLCPDGTNPHPRFQGMQTTLPPGGFIDTDGRCKIRISASVNYWCSASSSQGSGAVRYIMNFDREVPEDLMVYVAHRRSGTYNNCTGFPNNQCNHLAFTSFYYNLQFPPSTRQYDGDGLFINLTQGMTAHTTPFPKLSEGVRESSSQDPMNQQSCTDHMAQEYKTSAVYFKVGNNEPDIYVADFRLSNTPSNNPNLQFINQW